MNRMQAAGRSLVEPVRIRKLDKWKNDAEQGPKEAATNEGGAKMSARIAKK